MFEPAEPYPVRSVETLQVLRTTALIGEREDGGPARVVEQYWTLEGKLLFKVDRWREQQQEVARRG